MNFETFGGFKGILKGEEEQNLSDALYAFRQNHNQFHKNIVNAISHYDRLDYIPDTSCADDIDRHQSRGTWHICSGNWKGAWVFIYCGRHRGWTEDAVEYDGLL